MIRLLLVGAALALAATACNGKSKNKPTGNGTGAPQIAGPCGELAEAVRRLYRGETTGNAELDADLLEANVHMVLTDCSTDPDRYVGCIRRSASVAALERDCLVPLDDEGKTEARQFQ